MKRISLSWPIAHRHSHTNHSLPQTGSRRRLLILSIAAVAVLLACSQMTPPGSISTTSSNLRAQPNPMNSKRSCALGATPRHLHRPCKKNSAVSVACTGQGEQQSTHAVAAPQEAQAGTFSVEFRTRDGCRLGISRYPDFAYNAQGGRGVGVVASSGEDSGTVLVEFDVASLYIPAMSGATTRFLGLPLPPFIKIDILPEALRGNIDPTSGQVDLKFRSRFCFSVGNIYRAPPLFVDTMLTSEESSGAIRRGTGERMDGEGRCKLVGVAVVDPIDDVFMNTFLSLPTECIAYLNATISIIEPS